MKYLASVIGVVVLALIGFQLFKEKPAQEVVQAPDLFFATSSSFATESRTRENVSPTRHTDQLASVPSSLPKTMNATINTNQGVVTLELFADRAPNTVANFAKLAQEGFYNGTKFHRVIRDFMIQGGDPLTKDDAMQGRWGTGGPGYQFADEIHADNHNNAGTISMANSGPNTNGSQFFINTKDNNFLDPKHTVFGRVTAGMDIVMAISGTAVDANDRPLTPIRIESISVQ